MVFQTGSCIAIGAKSEEENKKAIRQFARSLQKLFQVKYRGFKINSVSGAFNLGFACDLSKLEHLPRYMYNPETFAGAVLYYKENKSLMVFHTGCVTITGCKSIKEMQDDHLYILKLLQQVKK